MHDDNGSESGTGVTVVNGGRHFGRWWAAEVESVHLDSVARAHGFIGYHGADVVTIRGLDAARTFADQLLSAIEYAEAMLTRGPE